MQRRKSQDRRHAGGSSHLDHSVTSVGADRCLSDVAAIYLVQHTRADRTAWCQCVVRAGSRSLRAVSGPAARLLVTRA